MKGQPPTHRKIEASAALTSETMSLRKDLKERDKTIDQLNKTINEKDKTIGEQGGRLRYYENENSPPSCCTAG